MKNILTTYVLILLNVLIFVLMLKFGGSGEIGNFSIHTLLVFGADYTPLVKLGQWYRPIAAMFIHLNFLHLLMNMAALFQVGIPLEKLYGRPKYTALYLFAGLTGAAASLLFYARAPVVSAGASGAITGLIGAAAVASHRAGPAGVKLRNVMLRWLLMVFGYGFMVKADNAAHFGGLVGGALLALVMRPSPLPRLRIAPMDAPDSGVQTKHRIQAPDTQGLLPGPARPETGPGFETILLVAIVAVTFGTALHRRDEALASDDLINKGVEAAKEGRDDEAIALYRRALVLDPRDATAHFDLGLALGRRGDHDAAVAAFAKAIEIGGVANAREALIDEHVSHARELALAEKLPEAEEALKPALALDDRHLTTLSVLAFVQTRRGDRPAAIATLRKALSITEDEDVKKQLAAVLINHAVDLERADKAAATTALYREATTLDPRNDTAWFDLGLSLYAEKDWPGTADALERSIALSPRRGAYETLAYVYGQMGDEKKAKEMEAAAEKMPKKE